VSPKYCIACLMMETYPLWPWIPSSSINQSPILIIRESFVSSKASVGQWGVEKQIPNVGYKL
jgi:hypothetical protein